MGAGSINSMIISLKNNKKLLIRRKTFFDRKHSHEELRSIYSKKINRNEKPLSEAEKSKIRESIRTDFKRENRIRLAVVLSCIILIPTITYLAFSGFTLRSPPPAHETSQITKSTAYTESMQNGFLNLQKNQPFFAISHFENALAAKPDDQLATEQLILSYLMLCDQNEKTCEMAQAKIDSLSSLVK